MMMVAPTAIMTKNEICRLMFSRLLIVANSGIARANAASRTIRAMSVPYTRRTWPARSRSLRTPTGLTCARMANLSPFQRLVAHLHDLWRGELAVHDLRDRPTRPHDDQAVRDLQQLRQV